MYSTLRYSRLCMELRVKVHIRVGIRLCVYVVDLGYANLPAMDSWALVWPCKPGCAYVSSHTELTGLQES